MLAAGLGITNLVPRATARADELTDDELRDGLPRLEALAERVRPRVGRLPRAVVLPDRDRRAAGRASGRRSGRSAARAAWLLPNPSGLNASWQLPRLAEAYGALREAVRPS